MFNKPHKNFLKSTLEFIHEHIIGIIIIVVVCSGLVSTFFIVKDNMKTEEEKAGIQYETVNQIYIPMTNVKTLNPLLSKDEDTYHISQMVFNSLFDLSNNLNIRKELVSSYSTDDRDGIVSIKLKSGINFHNGSNLSAYDIKYTVEAIKAVGSEGLYFDMVSKIDSVIVNGNYNLKVVFKDPKDAALDNLVFPIVSSSQYGSPHDFARAEDYNPVGTGQYQFIKYDKLSSLSLKPNQDYFGDIAKNKIIFQVIPNRSKATNLMTMDNITAYLSTDQNINSIAEDKKLKVHRIMSNEVEYIAFNFKNKYLSKLNIRNAIAKAIDINSVIENAYMGNGVATDSIYFPEFLGTENKGDHYPYSEESATELVKIQGYFDRNDDGYVEDVKNNKIQLSILVNSNNVKRVDAANIIAEYLNNIGIKAKVDKVPWNEYKSRINAKNFDILIGGYKFEKRYDLRDLFNSNNKINYKNKQVVYLVNKMETAITAEEYKETYLKLKEMLWEDLPYYPICYKTYSLVTVNKFSFDKLPTFFDIYRNIDSWSWQKIVLPEQKKDI